MLVMLTDEALVVDQDRFTVSPPCFTLDLSAVKELHTATGFDGGGGLYVGGVYVGGVYVGGV